MGYLWENYKFSRGNKTVELSKSAEAFGFSTVAPGTVLLLLSQQPEHCLSHTAVTLEDNRVHLQENVSKLLPVLN